MNLALGDYYLQFQCAARPGVSLSTSGFMASWNNVVVVDHSIATDYLIHTY